MRATSTTTACNSTTAYAAADRVNFLRGTAAARSVLGRRAVSLAHERTGRHYRLEPDLGGSFRWRPIRRPGATGLNPAATHAGGGSSGSLRPVRFRYADPHERRVCRRERRLLHGFPQRLLRCERQLRRHRQRRPGSAGVHAGAVVQTITRDRQCGLLERAYGHNILCRRHARRGRSCSTATRALVGGRRSGPGAVLRFFALDVTDPTTLCRDHDQAPKTVALGVYGRRDREAYAASTWPGATAISATPTAPRRSAACTMASGGDFRQRLGMLRAMRASSS